MGNVPEPSYPDRPDLRVSHADREQVAARLQQALADGRLDLDELDERLRVAYAAKTYGDLAPLTRDLPAMVDDAGQQPEHTTSLRPTSRWALALMSGFTRRGAWVVPRRFHAVTVMGGGKMDLRHARFADNEVEIRIFALMGGVEITVPPEVHVNVTGFAIMGGWDQPRDGASTPGGPRLTVSGFALMGGVAVKREPRKKSD